MFRWLLNADATLDHILEYIKTGKWFDQVGKSAANGMAAVVLAIVTHVVATFYSHNKL